MRGVRRGRCHASQAHSQARRRRVASALLRGGSLRLRAGAISAAGEQRASEQIAAALAAAAGQAKVVAEAIEQVSDAALASGEHAKSLKGTAAAYGAQAARLTADISSFVTEIRAVA